MRMMIVLTALTIGGVAEARGGARVGSFRSSPVRVAPRPATKVTRPKVIPSVSPKSAPVVPLRSSGTPKKEKCPKDQPHCTPVS